MVDAIGNKIVEGGLVHFEPPPELIKIMVWSVVYVSDGGIATPDGKESPPMISLRLDMPIGGMEQQRGREPRLADFLCVPNPKAAEIIAKMAAGQVQ